MGNMKRRGKRLWAWLADFLSTALQEIACFLSGCLSQFLFLSAARWSAMKGGMEMETDDRKRLKAAASEGMGKINFGWEEKI